MKIDVLETRASVLDDNDARASEVRKHLQESGTFFVNLMGSPGAGKTSVLVRTIEALREEFRIGVIEADVDSDVDARAISSLGVRVLQMHTGGSCHTDAAQAAESLTALDIADLDLVFLENVGNLVCPAEFDVGADLQVTILSVPEGDDKPLKYPLMFQVADCLLVNKVDTSEIFDFSLERCRANIETLRRNLPMIPLSAKEGEEVQEWLAFLTEQITRKRGGADGQND